MARTGTKKNPFILRVQNEERAAEILAFLDSRNWYAIFEINDEAEEDLDDLDIKINELPLQFDAPKIGRNHLCPCGSGKKFKKCCVNSLKLPLTQAKEKICAHCEIEEFLAEH